VLAVIGAAAGFAVASGAFATNGPSASTGAAREVINTSATLSGTVQPNGQPTEYAFQYGSSTQYPQETAVQNAGSGVASVAVTATVTGLQPGTTYHFRLIAANARGSATGADVTFKTAGLAPAPGAAPSPTTGAASATGAHEATLNGTIGASLSKLQYYFQIGPRVPYELETISRVLAASKLTTEVQASVIGLENNQLYHYRLVAVGESGEIAAGPDRTFKTAPTLRLNPRAIEASASPSFQRTLPDVVTVSGRLVPPAGLSRSEACQGFVDITFRVRTIAIQMLRAGLRSDCTFSLPVRFSVRRRLRGGHVQVHVLFPGNQFLHRMAAPTQTIQIG
jgi:hypothetical protein